MSYTKNKFEDFCQKIRDKYPEENLKYQLRISKTLLWIKTIIFWFLFARKNILIEYQGEQHFQSIKFFAAKRSILNKQKMIILSEIFVKLITSF